MEKSITFDTADHVEALKKSLLLMPFEAQIAALKYLYDWAHAARFFQTPPPVIQVLGPDAGSGAALLRRFVVNDPPPGPEASGPEPGTPALEEAPEPAAPPNQGLVEWVSGAPGRGDALAWLGGHLADQVGSEIRLAELHATAKQAGAQLGCPTRTATGKPADCDGRLSGCGLKLALQMLAADPDFPLVVHEAKRGPWGPTYVCTGFEP